MADVSAVNIMSTCGTPEIVGWPVALAWLSVSFSPIASLVVQLRPELFHTRFVAPCPSASLKAKVSEPT